MNPVVTLADHLVRQLHHDVRVAGVDLSLTSTGVAVASFDREGQVEVETACLRTRLLGHDRLEEIVVSLGNLGRAVDLVVLEGLAAGSRTSNAGTAVHVTSGNWWLVAHELWRAQTPVAVVSPMGRAKYATGNGGAGKAFVVEAVASTYRHLLTLPARKAQGREDIADAVALMAMGCRSIGRSVDGELPTDNVRAMDRVEWPELAR